MIKALMSTARHTAIALLAASCVTAHAQQQPTPPPCKDDPIFRQQDFTVGHWDVFSKDGKKTAEVRMEKVLKDCTIFETWTTLDNRPGNGLGFFTYSRLLKEWAYFWVSDTGQTTHFRGALAGKDNMRFVTEAPLPGGGKRLRHWSLILQPDGSVRELAVGTVDGKEWTTDYDLLWRKKSP